MANRSRDGWGWALVTFLADLRVKLHLLDDTVLSAPLILASQHVATSLPALSLHHGTPPATLSDHDGMGRAECDVSCVDE